MPADLILELRAVILRKGEFFVGRKLLISPGTVHTEEITHRIRLMRREIAGIRGESGIAFRVIRVETLRSGAKIGDSHPDALAERGAEIFLIRDTGSDLRRQCLRRIFMHPESTGDVFPGFTVRSFEVCFHGRHKRKNGG